MPKQKEPPKDEVEEYVPPHDNFLFPQIEDVLGAADLKRSLEEIVFNVDHPQVFAMLGTTPDKSYLFNGPPGTGKTMAAKAVRNHLTNRGTHIAWMPYEIGIQGTCYINMGSKVVQNYFNTGRKLANKGATVLYFVDEADVVFGHRHNDRSSHKEDDKLLNTFMTNIQEINDSDSPEFIFLATNYSKALDEAAVRAGRINRVIEFPLPSEQCLYIGYERYVAAANGRAKFKVFENNIDYTTLAMQSKGFSYADVAEVVKQTIRNKTYEFLRNQELKVVTLPTIRTSDIATVVESHKKTRRTLDKSISREQRIGFLR